MASSCNASQLPPFLVSLYFVYVFVLPVWRSDSRNRRDQMKRRQINSARRVEIVINQLGNDNKRKPQIKVSKMGSVHTDVGCKWSGPGKNRYQQYDQFDNNYVTLSSLATRHRHHTVVRVQDSQPHPWQTVDALLCVIACRTEYRIGSDRHTVTRHDCVLESVRTGHPRLAAAAAAVAAEQYCLLRFFLPNFCFKNISGILYLVSTAWQCLNIYG